MRLKDSLEFFGISPLDEESILKLSPIKINGDKQLKRELIKKQREIKLKALINPPFK